MRKYFQTQNIALLLVIIGLFLLYFWPSGIKYEKIGISQIKIADEGKWIEIDGVIREIKKRKTGFSLQICEDDCINVYVNSEVEGNWIPDDPIYSKSSVKVFGDVGVLHANRFVRAHKINLKGS